MKNKVYYIFTVILIGLFVIFKPLADKKFYGFEYEDSFVNPHIASQKDIVPFVESYRTMGCESFQNGECVSVSSYTGHYATYSLYLFSITKIFKIAQNHLIHKIGNTILVVICFLFVFFFYKQTFSIFTLFFGIISCLPALYVFNSGLIENISFSLGLMLLVTLYNLKVYKNDYWLVIYLLLLLLLINIKRENLIYATTIVVLDPKRLVKNYLFWIGLGIIVLSQALINPFYTEGLESTYLGRSTFSYDYFKFQFPTYLSSFFRIDGFLIVLILIFSLVKPTKESLLFLGIWILFILSYSFHYRGQYAIAAGKITHFETFRYMFNTLPLLIGYFLFGKFRENIKKIYPLMAVGLLCIFTTFSNWKSIEGFADDELYNYHLVNEKLNTIAIKKNGIAIHDNFVLISMLNSSLEDVDIFSANPSEVTYSDGKENFLINRFKILNIENYKGIYDFKLIDSLSTESTPVYRFIKTF